MTQSAQRPVFRFAPSPNGEIHLGHALSALINLRLARKMNGTMLLRIEDIDTDRCTRELEKQMLEDLEWIGFEWDAAPLRQSSRFGEYDKEVKHLQSAGLVYPAQTSRSDIKRLVAEKKSRIGDWPNDPDGSPHYPGNERDLGMVARRKIIESGMAYALRLDTGKALLHNTFDLGWTEFFPQCERVNVDAGIWGDIVIARKDVPASYHLSSVLDDFEQGVTHVVRGNDLRQATAIHRLLQAILGFSEPLYHHHQLVLDETGRKLSKSLKSSGIRSLRNNGCTAEQVREMAFSHIAINY